MVRFVVVFLLSCLSVSWAADITFLRQNSEPKYLADGSGLCDQIYQFLQSELAKQGYEAEILTTRYPIKRILVMMDTGAGDAFCGAGVTNERREKYVYSELPMYAVSNVLMANKNETRIPKSFDDIAQNQWIIGAFYGTSSSNWLKSHPGVIVNDSYTELDRVTELVAENNGLHYFFYHDLGLNYYVQKSGLPVKVLPTKFRTINQWMLYRKDLPDEVLAAVEAAVTTLTESGQLGRIQRQYLNVDD